MVVTILVASLAGPVAPPEREDQAKLLQTLLILWAYLDFMQLLIVWQSDLPNEAAWYLARSSGTWAVAGRIDRRGAFSVAVSGPADPAPAQVPAAA